MATIKNLDRLLSRLNNVANMDVKNAVNQATKVVHAQAKLLAPVDTGNLAGSIHMKVQNKGAKVEGQIYTNLQYAPFVEFGTGSKGNGTYPYKIKGVSLAYTNKTWTYTLDGGETFYRTRGQVAQPYMYPALKRNEAYIKKLIKSSVKTELKNSCKGG